MRLKSFHAKSMGDAMKQVRDALGDEAIIVTTREGAGGIHVTAAVEKIPESKFEIREPKKSPPKKQVSEDQTLGDLTELFLKHRTPARVTDKIVSYAAASGASTVKAALIEALTETYRFQPLPVKRAVRPIVLVGPPGAGKTLTSAKLAARATMNGLVASVISTDTVRAGGCEQLQAFLTLMKIDLKTADDIKALKSALKDSKGADQIIIDTGGLNPFDPHEMKELARILAVDDMDAVLVLPAGGDAEESAEIALTFGVLGVKKILPTRLDFARRLGGILTAAERSGMSFTDASHTPAVAKGLLPLSAKVLADVLMPSSGKKA